ncbi:DUF3618 domain-containing protein [Phytoactinopolyspora alkaliphila]|uniref:DUF3618 domain-containing protein n=1 Tax=Phytoactinopolyspora alkaliphila TaxID=1783498 RepID=A0A6N9YNC6_9ACTN|nr:DUF3618 domain-containing protein [Phytoactinopolyspora alkaliphila]
MSAPAVPQEESERRPKRSIEEIERTMAQRSERLSRNLDELANRAKPANLARQAGMRPELLGALAGAVLVAGFLVWRVRRRR